MWLVVAGTVLLESIWWDLAMQLQIMIKNLMQKLHRTFQTIHWHGDINMVQSPAAYSYWQLRPLCMPAWRSTQAFSNFSFLMLAASALFPMRCFTVKLQQLFKSYFKFRTTSVYSVLHTFYAFRCESNRTLLSCKIGCLYWWHRSA